MKNFLYNQRYLIGVCAILLTAFSIFGLYFSRETLVPIENKTPTNRIKEVVEKGLYAGYISSANLIPQKSTTEPSKYLSPITQNKLKVIDYYNSSGCCDMKYIIVYIDESGEKFWIKTGGGYQPKPDVWYGPFNLK